jgi:opacity protein-like surface antigen
VSNNRQWVISALALFCSVGSSAVMAQYYVGIEGGSERQMFKQEYTALSSGELQTFEDEAKGSTGGVLLGHRWKVSKAFFLALQGRVSVSDSEWTLNLDIPEESAKFRYDMPLSTGVSILPMFHLTDDLTVFAEGGIAYSRIREQKSQGDGQPVFSVYNIDQWKPGLIAGVGVSLALDQHWSIRLAYRRTWYKDLTFSTEKDGTAVEEIRSTVVQSTATIGLVRQF